MQTAYLIGTRGQYKDHIIALKDLDEWIFGRDPALSYETFEDPMVSRKHFVIRHEDDLFFLENFSNTNPVKVNDLEIDKMYQLHEGDQISVGGSSFLFTLKNPAEAKAAPEDDTIYTVEEMTPHNLLIKVLSGPNHGAEFGIEKNASYLLGKDPFQCDIVFQDLSVSKEHARIFFEDEKIMIEDRGSKNGTFINGEKITAPTALHSGDLIAVGTTSFLLIDRETSRETLYSPKEMSLMSYQKDEDEEKQVVSASSQIAKEKDWKQTFIPNRYLILASSFALFIFMGIIALLSLFRSEPILASGKNVQEQIEETLEKYPTVQYLYNETGENLFLSGNILTEVEHAQMLYQIHAIPYIAKIEDTVIIDECVWDEMNALIRKTPAWKAVNITSTKPGNFVVRGYVAEQEDKSNLNDFLDVNFPYQNQLTNEVFVESNLKMQIQNILLENDMINIMSELSNGTVSLSGKIDKKNMPQLTKVLAELEKTPGIRSVKNFVIAAGESTMRVNISDKFKVTGVSKFNQKNEYVLINGQILGVGDTLDGMVITTILDHSVYLEKEGMKYKIDYNLP